MNRKQLSLGLFVTTALLLATGPAPAQEKTQLPSWNDGLNKKAILQFIHDVTSKGSPHFVPPAERIAVFDNDGTLWCEQPLYTQLFFALDRVRELGPKNPQWKKQQPFKAVLGKDHERLKKLNKKELLDLVMGTHTGMSCDEFDSIAKDWLATAKHPRFQRHFTELVYQPMLEVIALLQRSGFKTYIVSGGGIGLMRAYSEKVYGIPPEQVLGSSGKLKWVTRDGVPALLRVPELFFFDDEEDKPILIELTIGRRPIIAFGNSDGDLPMLQWTAAGKGKRMMVLVHHDDAVREYQYDRTGHIGRLDKALDAAQKHNWNVISMKDDWQSVFSSEKK